MSEYQAVYDAVRSKISGGNVGEVVERALQGVFDISHEKYNVMVAMQEATWEYQRPSAVYRPDLTVDGNMYCALYGVNLVEGCAGFGETADLAMLDFDKNWKEYKAIGPKGAKTP